MFDESDLKGLEIEAAEVVRLLEAEQDDAIELIDVREEWELARGVLPGAVHRPMSTLGTTEYEWPAEKKLIVYCEHGVRSLDVVMWLMQTRGITAQSIRGGFAEWRGPIESSKGAE